MDYRVAIVAQLLERDGGSGGAEQHENRGPAWCHQRCHIASEVVRQVQTLSPPLCFWRCTRVVRPLLLSGKRRNAIGGVDHSSSERYKDRTAQQRSPHPCPT